MTITDVVRKLIGPINPIGKSEVDAERLTNLENLITVVNSLLQDMDELVYNNRNAYEHSIKEAKSVATSFLTEMVSNFKDGYDTPKENI